MHEGKFGCRGWPGLNCEIERELMIVRLTKLRIVHIKVTLEVVGCGKAS